MHRYVAGGFVLSMIPAFVIGAYLSLSERNGFHCIVKQRYDTPIFYNGTYSDYLKLCDSATDVTAQNTRDSPSGSWELGLL